MRIYVHVREAVVPLQCGDGTQEVKWLGNAAMVCYDDDFGRKYGAPIAIRKEGGVACDLTARVCDVLDDNQHVFAELEERVDRMPHADVRATTRAMAAGDGAWARVPASVRETIVQLLQTSQQQQTSSSSSSQQEQSEHSQQHNGRSSHSRSSRRRRAASGAGARAATRSAVRHTDATHHNSHSSSAARARQHEQRCSGEHAASGSDDDDDTPPSSPSSRTLHRRSHSSGDGSQRPRRADEARRNGQCTTSSKAATVTTAATATATTAPMTRTLSLQLPPPPSLSEATVQQSVQTFADAAWLRRQAVGSYAQLHNSIERLHAMVQRQLDAVLRTAMQLRADVLDDVRAERGLHLHDIIPHNVELSVQTSAQLQQQELVLDALVRDLHALRASSVRFAAHFLSDDEKRAMGADPACLRARDIDAALATTHRTDTTETTTAATTPRSRSANADAARASPTTAATTTTTHTRAHRAHRAHVTSRQHHHHRRVSLPDATAAATPASVAQASRAHEQAPHGDACASCVTPSRHSTPPSTLSLARSH